MSIAKTRTPAQVQLPSEWVRLLGVRRSITLRRIMRRSSLPPEVLLDLALELLDLASRQLSPPPIRRQAVGLGAARWRNVSPEARSEALRRAAQARWSKHRRAVAIENSKKAE
jgi:hypothetical protein